MFERLWYHDNFIVMAAGNEGFLSTLGETIPQRLGSPGNALLLVGGVEQNGRYWAGTTDEEGGTIDISAVAVNVEVPHGSNAGYLQGIGTSFAAPQVAGLAAYFLSSPALASQLQVQGQVAMRMKNFLIDGSFPRMVGEPNVAYNLAEDELCAVVIPVKKRDAKLEKRRQVVEESVEIRRVENRLPKQKRAVEEVTVIASGTCVDHNYPLVSNLSPSVATAC